MPALKKNLLVMLVSGSSRHQGLRLKPVHSSKSLLYLWLKLGLSGSSVNSSVNSLVNTLWRYWPLGRVLEGVNRCIGCTLVLLYCIVDTGIQLQLVQSCLHIPNLKSIQSQSSSQIVINTNAIALSFGERKALELIQSHP